jgi:hypothetical protein
MAGDWLKIRLDLRDDPAVVMMARRLGLEEDAVVGKLVRFWSWANRHVKKNGCAPVTLMFIDALVGRAGFANSLRDVGWLFAPDAENIVIPKWNRHNSQTAKARALAAIRMAKSRLRSRCARGATKAQPEKRREEKSKPPPPPLRGRGRADGEKAQMRAGARSQLAGHQSARIDAERARRAEELRRQVHVEGALPPAEVRAALNGALAQAAARRGWREEGGGP